MAELLSKRDGFYLHISEFESAFFVFVSMDPVLHEEVNPVLDAEVVESRSQAHLWFNQVLREKPWEKYDPSSVPPYLGRTE